MATVGGGGEKAAHLHSMEERWERGDRKVSLTRKKQSIEPWQELSEARGRKFAPKKEKTDGGVFGKAVIFLIRKGFFKKKKEVPDKEKRGEKVGP